MEMITFFFFWKIQKNFQTQWQIKQENDLEAGCYLFLLTVMLHFLPSKVRQVL